MTKTLYSQGSLRLPFDDAKMGHPRMPMRVLIDTANSSRRFIRAINRLNIGRLGMVDHNELVRTIVQQLRHNSMAEERLDYMGLGFVDDIGHAAAGEHLAWLPNAAGVQRSIIDQFGWAGLEADAANVAEISRDFGHQVLARLRGLSMYKGDNLLYRFDNWREYDMLLRWFALQDGEEYV